MAAFSNPLIGSSPSFVEMAFKAATAQLESQTARAEEVGSIANSGQLSNFDVQALLKDVETATNPNQLQQILAGVGEGMMHSAYAGNRVMGAAIAKSAGYNEEQIAKQIGLKSQVINMARSVVDLKHAEITTKLAEKYGEKEIQTKIAGQEAQTKYVGALTTAAEVNVEESRVKLGMLREEADGYAAEVKTRRELGTAQLEGMKISNKIRGFEEETMRKMQPLQEQILKSQAAVAAFNATPENLDIMKRHNELANQLLDAQAARLSMESKLFGQRIEQQADFYKRTGWGPSQFGMAVQLYQSYSNTAARHASQYKIYEEANLKLYDEVNTLNQMKDRDIKKIQQAHPGWGFDTAYEYWRKEDPTRAKKYDSAYWQLHQNQAMMKDSWQRCQDAVHRADQLQNTLNDVDRIFSGGDATGYSAGTSSSSTTTAPGMPPEALVNPGQ